MTRDSNNDTDRTDSLKKIDRRHLLAGVGGTLATGLAGCNEQRSAEYDASPVRLEARVEEQGYALLEKASSSLNRTVDLPGVTLEVTLRNHFASYQHGSGLAVGLASTPAAEQSGQSLNPVATAPLGELLESDIGEKFVGQLDVDASWTRGPDKVGDHRATLLGGPVDAKTFAGVTEDDEFVLLNLARAETEEGDDAVLVGTAWTEPAHGDKPLVGEEGYVPQKIVDRSADEFRWLLSTVDHGEEPGDPGTPGYPSEVPQILDDPEEDALWKDLSGRVIESRRNGNQTRLNEELAEAAASVDSEGLAATFEFWIAENFRMAERHEEAVARYTEVLDRYGAAEFGDLDVAANVLRKRARSEEQMGRIDDALATYDELIAHRGENVARPYYLKGRAAEEAGLEDAAEQAYRNAAAAEDGFPNNPWPFPELGRRAAARLTNSFEEYYDDPEELLGRLTQAIREEAYDELRSLASPTHFTFGPLGGCCDYVETDAVLVDLIGDARSSEVSVVDEAVERTGGSVYLPTRGWAGEFFGGEVVLEVSESPQGWAFTGLGLHTSEEVIEAEREAALDASQRWQRVLNRWRTDWSPPPINYKFDVDTPTPTPSPTPTPKRSPKRTRGKVATMDISAPWETGQHFTAGGIIDWGVPKPAPHAGSCVAGPAGFYYKTGPTHSDFEDKHAIDFTQYKKTSSILKGPKNTAFGTEVLATNYGKVKHTYWDTKNGTKGMANKVVLDHMNGQLPGSGVYTDFRSRYLHLRYDVRWFGVSPGNFVDQEDELGEMDDTGNSALHHLHFNVRKIYNDESVQPTPMEGRSLKQTTSDNGSCIRSR